MIPVKICGITNLEDALACVRLGVSALGFVFAPSPRRVDATLVRQITRQLPPFVARIGVFVDEDPLVIKELLRDCGLDLAQLHGKESPAAAEVLEGRAIKAFRAGADHPDSVWREAPLQAVLVDAYVPGKAGGAGAVFDWKLFAEYRALGLPTILAGGLKSANIREALEATQADAVDLSSGVEASPGKKDPALIRRLMEEMQGINRQD